MNYQNLFKAIYELTGIHLQEDKIYLLESRLPDLMKKYSLSSFDELAIKVQSRDNPDLLKEFINSITTQETYFFRDQIIYEALIQKIIPEWLSRNGGEDSIRSKNMKLKIWSAGCATGQEPYSIAITIKENFPRLIDIIDIQATDISIVAVEKARRGNYLGIEVDRGVEDRIKEKYFKMTGNGYELVTDIRNLVRFSLLNLHIDAYPREMDIVFCRNVAIYFHKEDRKKIYTRLRNSLRADGILALGSAESLYGFIDDFIIQEYKICRYYQFKKIDAFKETFF